MEYRTYSIRNFEDNYTKGKMVCSIHSRKSNQIKKKQIEMCTT